MAATAEQDLAKGFSRISLSRRSLIANNFFGGLAWGFGSVLGATVVFALVIWVLGILGAVPFLGNTINSILDQVDPSRLHAMGFRLSCQQPLEFPAAVQNNGFCFHSVTFYPDGY